MKYRQLSQCLRISRGPGKPVLESERPRNKRTGKFLDSDDEPTLIEIGEGDQVDVASLLAIGAIAPYTAPGPPRRSSPAKDGASQ